MRAPWPRPLTPRRRRALAREIEEEMRAHLAMRAEDNERDGMTPAEAEADARARFGDVEHLTEACLWAEQTHPLREVQRLLVTGLIFALGFGAFATAFSLAFAVWVRPLRFHDADRLMRSGSGWENAHVPYAYFESLRARSTGFEHVTAFDATEFRLDTDELPARAMLVTEDYFDVFGVAPLLGRGLSRGEQKEILVSEAFWERAFGRSRSVLGRVLSLDGESHTIVGVMPGAAQLSHRVELWHRLPAARRADGRRLYIVGRLREGATLDDVRAETETIGAELGPRLGAPVPVFHPLKRVYVDPVRTEVKLALAASVLALLLIALGALWRAVVRARRAARYGSESEGEEVQVGLSVMGAVAGLGVARLAQPLVYDHLLGRWGPMFDRSLDAPVVLVVLAAGLAVGAVLVLGRRWGLRTQTAQRVLG